MVHKSSEAVSLKALCTIYIPHGRQSLIIWPALTCKESLRGWAAHPSGPPTLPRHTQAVTRWFSAHFGSASPMDPVALSCTTAGENIHLDVNSLDFGRGCAYIVSCELLTSQWFVGKTLSSLCRKGNNSEEWNGCLNCIHLSLYVRETAGSGLCLPIHDIHETSGSVESQVSNTCWITDNKKKKRKKEWVDEQKNISQPEFPRQEELASLETSQGETALQNPAQPLLWPVVRDVSSSICSTDWKGQTQSGTVNGPVWTVN